MGMLDDEVEGYFLLGQNPAVGSAHGRMQRLGMAHLKWLVVRDLNLIESATWWKDGPEIASGELRDRGHRDRGVLLPRGHARGEGGIVHPDTAAAAVAAQGGRAARRLPERMPVLLRARQADQGAGGRIDRRARPAAAGPDVGLPDRRARRDRQRGGAGRDQRLSPHRPRRRQAGVGVHRAARRRVDRRRLLDLLRRVRRRHQPGCPPRAARRHLAQPVGVGLGMAGRPADPLQPRVGRPGRQAVERTQEIHLVGRRSGSAGSGTTCRTSRPTGRRAAAPTPTSAARPRWRATTRSSCKPTARAGCSPPRAWSTGRCPRTTNRRSRRSPTRCTRSSRTRRESSSRARTI